MKPEERYVRACAVHLVALERDGLMCPGKAGYAPHLVARWVTYDRARGVVLDVVDAEKGHERELRMRAHVRVDQAALATPALEKEDDMPRGIPGPAAGAGGASKPEARVLETRRFVVGEDSVLMVRLRQVKGRDEASRFRIVWELSSREGKAVVTKRGTVSIAPTEEEIRVAWASQLQAIDKRWTPAPTSQHLKLQPIPAAPKAR